jgi:spermidine/putrescine transport system permease protein
MSWLRRLPPGVYLGVCLAFIYLPSVMLVLFSFQHGLLPAPPFQGPSLEWYERMIANRRLIEALGSSVMVASLSALTATVLGFLAAYGMARRRRRFENAMRYLLMAPLMVSYLIIGMGLLVCLSLLGVPKSLFTVGLGHVIINLPLCFAMILSQLGEHQRNIERAAHDLGASDLKALLLVTVPMMWPSLFAAFFVSATLSWDEFIIAFLLSRFDVTLPVMIYEMLRGGITPELNAAGSVVFGISITLVVLAALFGLRRRKE